MSDSADRDNLTQSRWTIVLQAAVFAAWPPLAFLSGNAAQPFDAISLVGLWIGGVAVLLALAEVARRKFLRNSFRIFNVLCALYLVTFMYGFVDDGLKSILQVERSRWSIVGWSALGVSVSAMVWVLVRSRNAYKVFVTIIAAMCASSLISIGPNISLFSMAGDGDNPRETPSNQPSEIESGRRADVFVFFLDGYSRADTLKDKFNLDIQAFRQRLQGMGFTTLPKSFANYPMTTLSISSALNMDYLVEPGPSALENYVRYQVLLAGHNPFVRAIKARGYKFVQVPPGSWAGTDCRGAQDVCFRTASSGINETQITLLQMTPIETVLRRFFGGLIEFKRTGFPEAVAGIASFSRKVKSPVFAFTHLTIPHDPIYTASCEERPFSPYFTEALSPKRRGEYVETVRCLNRQILENLPKLFSGTPAPIIMLLSDHGITFGNLFERPVSDWTGEEIKGRYGNLISINAPERCQQHLYPAMSLVNTFRFALACIDGKPPQYLKDRLFLARYKRPEVVEGVPERLR